MGFVSFAGRVFFASVFLLAAYQEFSEFGVHGGRAAKSLWPKYNLFMKHVSSHLGIVVPHVEMKHVIASTIFLKGFGGLLFIFSSSFGAYLLLLYLAFITPVVYVFYNYDIEKPEFEQLFSKFAQNLALFGALLFFIGMQNSIPRRQPKKVPKSKKQIKLRCLVVHTVQVGESGNVNDSHLRILQHVHHSLSRSRFFGEAYKTLMRCELRLRIVFLVYHFVIFLGLQVWTGVVCELIFTNSYIYVLFVT